MCCVRVRKLQLALMIALGTTCGWSQETVDKMPSKIASTNYSIDHRDGVGRTNVFLDRKLFMSLFWTQRWTGVKASDVKTTTTISKDRMVVTVHSTYNWGQGKVDETRRYTTDSIKVDYTYIPHIDRVKTSKINLYFKFYDIGKDRFSYTRFGNSGGIGTFGDIAKGKKAICSSIAIKNFLGKDVDIATGNNCKMVLEERKSQVMAIVFAADTWKNPYTHKGHKYQQSLVFEFLPAKDQTETPATPLKVTY